MEKSGSSGREYQAKNNRPNQPETRTPIVSVTSTRQQGDRQAHCEFHRPGHARPVTAPAGTARASRKYSSGAALSPPLKHRWLFVRWLCRHRTKFILARAYGCPPRPPLWGGQQPILWPVRAFFQSLPLHWPAAAMAAATHAPRLVRLISLIFLRYILLVTLRG